MKLIPNTDGLYSITKGGIIYNNRTKNLVAQWMTRKGYVDCRLKVDGKWTVQKVHRIVALTYLDNPNNLPQINHIDGNKNNNCVNNLEWCDQNHNIKHAYKNGLKKPLNKPVICVETSEIYKSIRQAGRQFGLHSETNISNVCNGRWKTAYGLHWRFVSDNEYSI